MERLGRLFIGRVLADRRGRLSLLLGIILIVNNYLNWLPLGTLPPLGRLGGVSREGVCPYYVASSSSKEGVS